MPTKLAQYNRFKRNPELEMFKEFSTLNKKMSERMASLEAGLIDSIMKNPTLINAISNTTIERIYHIKQGEKGENGYTPVKGVDYFTDKEIDEVINFIYSNIVVPKDGKDGKDGRDGKDGKHGETPIAGVHYPTKAEIETMIKQEVYKLFSLKPKNKKTISRDEIMKLAGSFQKEIDFMEHADELIKAIESRRNTDLALDYYALKNRPVKEDQETGGKKIYARGGGSDVMYYDLSSFADGATKTFTIPANQRVVGVFGADVPGGNYRPVVDWTVSGVTLTLTDEVAAPLSGSTLWIIYVPR